MNNLQNKQDLLKAFELYNVLIYKYIYVRVGRSKELAQDLAQEIFMKAWQHRDSYDSTKATVKTWLFVITRNQLTDHFRRNRNNPLPLKDDIGFVEPGPDNDLLMQTILNRMNKLNDYDQELITLRFIEDLSIEDVARIVNKQYTATKIYIYRALSKLRKLVNENN